MMIARIRSLSLVVAALLVSADGAGEAQEAGQQSAATRLAREAGAIAGAARFCKIDEDKQELYLDRAQAQIALTARDEVDLVVAKFAFSSELSLASAIEPAGGCAEFERRFAARIAGLGPPED